jgi:hypothetical protein
MFHNLGEQRAGGSFWFGTQSLHCLVHGPQHVYPEQFSVDSQRTSSANNSGEQPGKKIVLLLSAPKAFLKYTRA